MTFADEQQHFSPALAARRAKYLGDLDGLIDAYEVLQSRDGKDRKELAALRTELQKLKRDNVRLREELRKAETDVVRLKGTLSKLRQSATMRAGKALLLPARGVRTAVQGLGRVGGSVPGAVDVADKGSAAGNPGAAALQPPAGPKVVAENKLPLSPDPTPGSVMQAVNHAYYSRGEITRPAELLQRHEALLTSLQPREQRTVNAVLGLDRLLNRFPEVPPRQPNPGYLAERGRIMYCAHSTAHFNSNGYSTRTGELVRSWVESGMDVTVAARPGYPWDAKVDQPKPPPERLSMEILGVNHIFSPGPSWSEQPLDRYWIEATDIYVREAQRMRAETIHSASNHVTALPALAAARRLGLPFSYEVRGLWEITEASHKEDWEQTERFALARRLETYVATQADIVFAITDEVKQELISRGVNPDRIRLLPNGVDTDRFAPLPAAARIKERLDLPDGVPVVGYAGSLVHYEGLQYLLEALALLKQDSVDFRAVIVGDGPELADLRRQASRLQLDGLVRFTGRVRAEEVPGYVSTFDIMPCPRVSLPVTELVSPLKPLEAMAAGKAMVLTDLAPMRAFSGPDESRALLAKPSDASSLADALRRLIDDSELRRVLGLRARLWTVQERQWRTIGRAAAAELAAGHAEAAETAPAGRDLRQITVGIIADTFTTEGLRPEVNLCELRPDSWRRQVENTALDALFVESAWEGADGKWNHKIGFYDDESFRDLRELLEYCNRNGIPTIFWNKEDPVHFNRFQRTAAQFDHVFTTDANCIRRYSGSPKPRTVASLPFYAQPQLHNPLPPATSYRHTVAYAGSYYGARYPERSKELATLLTAARPHGLTIYDRQYLNPESPYRFPSDLEPYVQGGLPYLEMVQAYKAHPVHLNVNSVDASPTMFSRRVVEVAASGTAVVSGRGSGVDQVLGGLVHTVAGGSEADLLLDRWMNNERARLADTWLGYRLVHRGHTAGHRLAYVLRCAGLVVAAPQAPRYALRVEAPNAAVIAALEAQTVRPTAVICAEQPQMPNELFFLTESEATPERLKELDVEWIGTVPQEGVDRTTYEDILTAVRFGEWSSIGISPEDCDETGNGLLTYGASPAGYPSLTSLHPEPATRPSVAFRRPQSAQGSHPQRSEVAVSQAAGRRVLVAGHDLKFASGIIEALEQAGHTVMIDQWRGHNDHDEEESKAKLAEADVIFCEWTLGNAVWYSRNLLPGQRLVTRFHSQELFTPHPKAVAMQQMDQVIFVGRHVADLAARDHGVPTRKATVIPNPVMVDELALRKPAEARFTLGLVGIVPAQKHLDRALDLLLELRSVDPRYRLRIKGKQPHDYPWMADRPDEMQFYAEQYRRIEEDPRLQGAVFFDGHGNDMPEWYQSVGVALSVSDFESFHLTLADGAASRAVPASLAWPGADRIYPAAWIHPTVPELAEYIRQQTSSEERWRAAGEAAHAVAAGRFGEQRVLPNLLKTIVGV